MKLPFKDGKEFEVTAGNGSITLSNSMTETTFYDGDALWLKNAIEQAYAESQEKAGKHAMKLKKPKLRRIK